ncbi:MAG: GH92 family glycosyl hydrolase [Candidatus Aminicenantes bacterium]|jgi:predicted alpha-1,2-mannosidase
MSRKDCLFILILVLSLISTLVCVSDEEASLTRFVDPFIGTGGHGHAYPGASLPFGMVQLSPDTRLTGWDGCSGYHISDSVIYGFSHTHLSGTGVSDYGDILLMPVVGPLKLERGSDEDPDSGYCSRFLHEKEEASPGYYRVFLEDYGVGAELTCTERVGFHKYTFPEGDQSYFLFDLTHRDRVLESQLRIVGDSQVEGMRRSQQWAQDQHVYFVAQFSKPFESFGISQDDKITSDLREVAGTKLKAYVQYSTKKNETIYVKVGISAVSIDGARKNLETEIPGWDFSAIVKSAEHKWNQALSKIQVEGGTEEQSIIFYTALYHSLLNPNLYMDVDGLYRGMDLEIHRAEDFVNYTVFSLWDTYRATHPLFTIIEPERTVDFIKTFLKQYEHGGRLPIWELAANYTGCMIGYHSIPVIADAYMKGIRSYDAEKALEAMKHSADLDHLGLEYYKSLGFIPADKESQSVSKTLEYAYDDWCIAQMAKDLGQEADYKRFIKRAQYYKNMFDPDSGFMRAKMNGQWFFPFDPAEVNFNYTEANSWQYSFYVPQDISGLIQLMGGKEKFAEKLDGLFAADPQTSGRLQPDITGLIGQYAHGNEPSHHMAYLYNYANQPWKTQERVREIMLKLYSVQPDGLCGNEDCGQMSSWYVLSALGFYPVCPGNVQYVIGTPLFPEARIDCGKGKTFVIRANNDPARNIYIQSATLNGEPYKKSYVLHEDVLAGGELIFEMGAQPAWEWGSQEDDIPISEITDFGILPVPFITSGERTFFQSTEIVLGSLTADTDIYYTLDGTDPTVQSPVYKQPIRLKKSATVKASVVEEGQDPIFVMTARFTKITHNRKIALNTAYSSQYSAGGDMALIDTLRGSDDFRSGTWQGYHGVDIDAVVDLGKRESIKRIATGFLQDQNSWIFMPLEVEYAVSEDGKNFRVIGTSTNDISPEEDGTVRKDFGLSFRATRARFVRIRAKSRKICPPWHPGSGNKAWIFADEILIE